MDLTNAGNSSAVLTSDTKGINLPSSSINITAYVSKDKKSAMLILQNTDNVGYSIKLNPKISDLGLDGDITTHSFTDPFLNGYAYPVAGSYLRFDMYPNSWHAIQINKGVSK